MVASGGGWAVRRPPALSLSRLDNNHTSRGLTKEKSIPLVLTFFCSTDLHSSVQYPHAPHLWQCTPSPPLECQSVICNSHVSRWLWVLPRRKKAAPWPLAGPLGSRVPVGSSEARCYSSLT